VETVPLWRLEENTGSSEILVGKTSGNLVHSLLDFIDECGSISPKGWHTLCRWCEPPVSGGIAPQSQLKTDLRRMGVYRYRGIGGDQVNGHFEKRYWQELEHTLLSG
jgi:hypothetical protein